MLRRVTGAALAAGLLLLLTACGDSGDETGGGGPSFNDADVAFAQQMIPHHESAVEMAEMAATRADSPEVKALAERIMAAQAPEIELLRGFLEGYGEDADAPMAGMDHGASSMGLADADMDKLDGATGSAFDAMFLQMMIKHHGSAIEMADTEIEQGEHGSAITLARKIRDDQTAEISEMEKLAAAL